MAITIPAKFPTMAEIQADPQATNPWKEPLVLYYEQDGLQITKIQLTEDEESVLLSLLKAREFGRTADRLHKLAGG